jgi:hypothetical protein
MEDAKKPAELLAGLIDIYALMPLLGINSRQAVYVLLREGMPSIKIGGRRFFSPPHIKEWILDRETTVT